MGQTEWSTGGKWEGVRQMLPPRPCRRQVNILPEFHGCLRGSYHVNVRAKKKSGFGCTSGRQQREHRPKGKPRYRSFVMTKAKVHCSLACLSCSSSILRVPFGLSPLFLLNMERSSLGFDETLSGYFNSSSPGMAAHSAIPNSIIMERERRRRLNRSLYNLRSVVPNMTNVKSTAATAAMLLQLMHLILVFGVQMSKAAIIFDAINYIQQLQEQERSLLEEISEQESHGKRVAPVDGELCHAPAKKRRTAPRCSCSPEPELPMMPSVDAMAVSVRELGNGITVISITCSKKRHAMVRVCKVVESLDLRIISASVDGGQSAHLKEKIEATFVHLMPQEATASLREADPLKIARPRTPFLPIGHRQGVDVERLSHPSPFVGGSRATPGRPSWSANHDEWYGSTVEGRGLRTVELTHAPSRLVGDNPKSFVAGDTLHEKGRTGEQFSQSQPSYGFLAIEVTHGIPCFSYP
ncbi:hypothetical protein B296_00013192 [Ensete ventricosum]|uniref:BHLH domain-containing protein n=1 Tax=Ensete ventricosum TaxID=4639 RepID=A0A426ZZ03_ENSVE|nr:hypothetical protein B296_00013192 [Ensete ventricosum]